MDDSTQHTVPKAIEVYNDMLDKDPLCTSTEMMIAFAKLHVDAALKNAAKNATTEEVFDNPINHSMGSTIQVDKDSILTAYSSDNII